MDGIYSLLSGMKTLSLRVKKQNESAMIIANHLQSHPLVEQVNYPGLETHQCHLISKDQMHGIGGGMLFFMCMDRRNKKYFYQSQNMHIWQQT